MTIIFKKFRVWYEFNNLVERTNFSYVQIL